MGDENEVELSPNCTSEILVRERDHKEFDFIEFCTNIKKCIIENNADVEDIELKYYLLAYEQLHSFFVLLGGAFQFVASDVKSKIQILEKFQLEELEQNESIVNFFSVNSMITYEMNSNLLEKSKYVSGSRTLLRLHRGLDFIRLFLKGIYDVKNNVKLGGIARTNYDKTLADHHSWIIKKTARVAMQFLPTREDLFKKITKNDNEKLNMMLSLFPEAFISMNTVFERVQNMYVTYDLLDLP